jgi:hypothetical protein
LYLHWGGGGAGVVKVVVVGGGSDKNTHLHPNNVPHDGANEPPTPSHQQSPRKGVRTLCALPGDAKPLRDHTQVRRVLGGGGKWRQQVSRGACVHHLMRLWRRPFNDHSGSAPDSQLPLHQAKLTASLFFLFPFDFIG